MAEVEDEKMMRKIRKKNEAVRYFMLLAFQKDFWYIFSFHKKDFESSRIKNPIGG
jgi:hypothetical protein